MGDVSQMKDETGLGDLADSLGVLGDLVYDTKKLVKELNSDVAEQTRLLGNLCAGRAFDAHVVSDGGSSRFAGAPCAFSVTKVAESAASRRYRAHVAPGGMSRLRRRYRFARANAA